MRRGRVEQMDYDRDSKDQMSKMTIFSSFLPSSLN
jgi:hypothetical protein